MTFEKALEAMKQGKKVYRKSWKNTEMDKIYLSNTNLFTLICDDVFADDWEIYEEPQEEDEMTAERAVEILRDIRKMATHSYSYGLFQSEFRDAIDFAIETIKNQNKPEKNCQCDCKCKEDSQKYVVKEFDSQCTEEEFKEAIACIKDQPIEPSKAFKHNGTLQEKMKRELSRKFFELGEIEKDSLAVGNMLDIYRLLFEVER